MVLNATTVVGATISQLNLLVLFFHILILTNLPCGDDNFLR